MSKYYHKNCSQTSQKEEAREETHMEKVWSYHSSHHQNDDKPMIEL